jgi:hypothetical protein
MAFSLTILEGPEAGKTFDFDRVQITVGRTMENDVVLPDPSISRQHFFIRDKGGAYIIKDLESSNGTKLNGKPIKEEVIRSGDVIQAGKVRLRFNGGAQKKEAPTARGAPPISARRPPAKAAADKKPAPSAAPAPGVSSPRPASAKPVIKSAGLKVVEEEKPAPPPQVQKLLSHSRNIWEIVRSRFMRLDRRLRLVLLGVACGLLVLLVVKAFVGGQKIVRQIADHSDQIFAVGTLDSDGEPASFGVGGQVTYRCRDMARFRFKYASGRVVIAFRVGSIDKKEELTVKLNDVPIFNIPEPWAIGKWSDMVYRKLDRKHLIENQENTLSFVNNINAKDPRANENWGVILESLTETPLPAPDAKAAQENFTLGKKRYERKDVAPENLYLALQHLEKARDYLELLPENALPDIYGEASEIIDRINQELEARFNSWMFDAARAIKYGRLKEAIHIYKKLLQSFPNQEDPRHRKVREILTRYE